VLFIYNKLISDRELMVMKAAGISPLDLARPAIGVGIVFSILGLYVDNVIIPRAEQEFAKLQWQVKHDVSHMMFKEGEFTNVQASMTVFVTKQESDGSIKGILVNDERDPKKKMTLSAEKGRVIYTATGPRLILVNGVRNELTKGSNQQFSSLSFDRYSMDFGVSNKTKEKEIGARELTLGELLFSYNNPNLTKQQKNRYLMEGSKRILMPLYNLVLALIACTGLLVCNFNRRGQGKVITLSILAMIVMEAGDLIFGNLAVKHLPWLPMLFLNFFVPLFACIYLLVFYNPAKKKIVTPSEDFANA